MPYINSSLNKIFGSISFDKILILSFTFLLLNLSKFTLIIFERVVSFKKSSLRFCGFLDNFNNIFLHLSACDFNKSTSFFILGFL